jgi:hypothetical protein
VHATCRYFLRIFGPGAERGLVPADDAGHDDQRPDRLARRGDRPGSMAGQGVHPPVAGTGPGHRLQDVRAALDRDVVHHHQEHAPGPDVRPAGDRARRARPWRDVREVHPAAGALHLVPVVPGGLRLRLGQVSDLVGVPYPQVSRAGRRSFLNTPVERQHRHVTSALPGAAGCGYR